MVAYDHTSHSTLLLIACALLLTSALSSEAAIVPTGDVTTAYNGTDPWDVGGALVIGYDAPATLRIDATSEVNNTDGILAGFDTSTGEVTVNGFGSAWNNSDRLIVGSRGMGTLNIEDGAAVTNHNLAYLGQSATGSGTVNVTGQGSTWNSTGEFHIGHLGAGILNIGNGATVSHDGVSLLGFDVDATGLVTVTGTGTTWDTTGDIGVGNISNGTLNIEDGAVLSNDGTSYMGIYAGSTGVTTVTGAGAEWDSNGEMYIGFVGTGTLNIENGATANTGVRGWLGRYPGSMGTATVTGPGSLWEIAQHLYIGNRGSGTLNILNGGVVNNEFDGIVGKYTGSNGTANIDDSTWSISHGNLIVGKRGTGEMNISNGGVINSLAGYIGEFSTGIGTARVKDGSVWELSHSLTVGNYGQGILTVEDAAMVSVGYGVTLAQVADGIGTLNLVGGTLDLNGSDLSVGLGNGTFNFNGGTLKDAGSILLGEPFVQQGGSLAPGSSIGQTDIVGDYDLNAGAIEIELGGAGDPIDLITATGDIDIAALGTTLDLRALGNMAAGTYTLMETTGGTITGMFENVTPFNLFGVIATVQNNGTAITVTLDGNLVFADANTDGFVGIDDLNIVLANWNQNVTVGDILAGDLNGDGFVGIDDLNAVLGHWNQGNPPTTESLSSVPEPTSTICLVCLLGLSHRRPSHRA